MKILICIKEVPDQEAAFFIKDSSTWYGAPHDILYRMNSYDEYALEEALLIKDMYPNTEVHILSIGPDRVKKTIRRALEMGADEGFHIIRDDSSYIPSMETARLIARFARDKRYDCIFTGLMAQDTMAGQTGQLAAAIMKIPSASFVMKTKIDSGGGTVYAEREISPFRREGITLAMPALLTFHSGINRPRYPSLSNKLRAKKQEIIEVSVSAPLSKNRDEDVNTIESAGGTRKCRFVQGSPNEQAAAVMEFINEKLR